jgi:hypothetical protein
MGYKSKNLPGTCPEIRGSGVKKIRAGAIDLLEIFPLL